MPEAQWTNAFQSVTGVALLVANFATMTIIDSKFDQQMAQLY